MPTMKVMCPNCKATVTHECRHDAREHAKALLSWVPEGLGTPELMEALRASAEKNGWNQSDDEYPMEEQPFFGSQNWSYPLFGHKYIARTFHALVDNLVTAAGFDPHELKQEIFEEAEAEKARKAEIQRKAEEVKSKRKAVTETLKDERLMLDVRIAILDQVLSDRVSKRWICEEDFDHLFRYIEKYYGGGINPEINEERITALKKLHGVV